MASCQTHLGGPQRDSQSHAERFDLEFKPFARLGETLYDQLIRGIEW
jgi:hypothetical protein